MDSYKLLQSKIILTILFSVQNYMILQRTNVMLKEQVLVICAIFHTVKEACLMRCLCRNAEYAGVVAQTFCHYYSVSWLIQGLVLKV